MLAECFHKSPGHVCSHFLTSSTHITKKAAGKTIACGIRAWKNRILPLAISTDCLRPALNDWTALEQNPTLTRKTGSPPGVRKLTLVEKAVKPQGCLQVLPKIGHNKIGQAHYLAEEIKTVWIPSKEPIRKAWECKLMLPKWLFF